MADETQKVTMVPALAARAETGAMQFGDDWPGIFIRGDNALAYAMSLERTLHLAKRNEMDVIAYSVAEGLLSLLRSCDVRKVA